jgi:hypothetical protein
MSGHTPGPWKLYHWNGWGGAARNEADARLIAAARKMYEALKKIAHPRDVPGISPWPEDAMGQLVEIAEEALEGLE